MKVRLVAALLLIPLWGFSAPTDRAVVVTGDHYQVTSYAGKDAADTTLAVMESLLPRYNALFLFDVSKNKDLWNVTLYASKDAFDAALADQVTPLPTDYVFLQYADAKKSTLAAWVPAEGSALDEVRSLAYQGFFQYLWTYIPHPPAWLETGLATVFWHSTWDGKTTVADASWPLLDSLQALWKAKGPDLKALLSAPEGTLNRNTGTDLEAWALATFLLQGPDPSYARLFGSLLTALSTSSDEVANRDAIMTRFMAAKALDQTSSDLRDWWLSKKSYQTWVTEGLTAAKASDWKTVDAAFTAAAEMKPGDETAVYYLGLSSYELKDYSKAESNFAKLDSKSFPSGLVAYARGLTAFALKKNPEAKAFLETAKQEDSATYEKLVAPVLDLIP